MGSDCDVFAGQDPDRIWYPVGTSECLIVLEATSGTEEANALGSPVSLKAW